MTAEVLTIGLIVLTFTIYIIVGVLARAVDTKNFYVAGSNVPAVANGAAIAADWMSAASFLSMAGLISFLGYDGAIYLMGWTGGYVLLTMLLAPYLRKFGRYTVPDFIGDRYYSNTARAVAAVATILISLTYVAGQMRGVGIVFSRYLQVDIVVGVIIGVAIVGGFAIIGGMKSITWTQVAQYFILIIAYLIPAIAISAQLTGSPFPQFSFAVSDIAGRLSDIQVDLGMKNYLEPFQNLSKLNVFLIVAALMFGTAGLPHVITRFYTAKSVRAARWSGVWAIIFIALLYTSAPAIGMFAKYNLIDSLHEQPIEQVMQIDWVEKWEHTGLLQFDDKNDDGILQFSGDDAVNEVFIDPDIIVLSTPEVASLSPLVISLVAAGGVAAALSTASGLVLSMSSAVSHDLYYRIFRRNATERQRLRVARFMILISIIVAGYFGINPPGFVAEVVAIAFGLAASSLFPVIFLGIFYKRMNKEGAIAGMLSGLTFSLVTIVLIRSVKILGTAEPIIDSFFGVEAMGVGAIGMIINFVVAITVSRFTAPPPQEIQELVENIRIPRELDIEKEA